MKKFLVLFMFVLIFPLIGCEGERGEKGVAGILGPSGFGEPGNPGADGCDYNEIWDTTSNECIVDTNYMPQSVCPDSTEFFIKPNNSIVCRPL